MTSEKRTAIARWILGTGLFALTVALWPAWASQPVVKWLAIGATAALAALVFHLGIRTELGRISIVPTVAIMAYLTLGRDNTLVALTCGLLMGGAIRLAAGWRLPQEHFQPWWARVGAELAPAGRNGLALLAADASYRALGAATPLTGVGTMAEMLPLAACPAAYLVAYNGVLLVDLWLRGGELAESLRQYHQAVLGMQLLPLPLAPFAAIAWTRLGVAAFFAFEIILLTLAVVANRLLAAHSVLQTQVDRLRALTAINRSLRSSLEVEPLLLTVYLQVANLLRVKNLMIVLSSGTEQTPRWEPRLVVRGGHPLEKPADYPLDGFTRYVLDERDALLAPSVAQTAIRRGMTNPPPEARTWMGVPLRSGSRPLGGVVTWLEANQQPTRVFTQADLDLFTTIAVQTEMALENARLYDEAQRHAAQLARLNEISAEMNASLNPERLLELVASSVIEMADCNQAAIYLLNEDSDANEPVLAQAQGFSPGYGGRARELGLPLTQSERKAVLADGEIVTVSNVKAAGASLSAAAQVLADQEGFAAYACLPLRVQRRIIGMLAVYYDQPHAFTESEVELLGTFANQAGLAVANARIYQQVDIQLARRVGQIVRMSDISQRLSATLDLDTIFKLIVQSAIEGCNADAGVLVLGGDQELGFTEEGEPTMVAWRGFDTANPRRAPHIIAEELAHSPVLTKGEARLTTADDPSAAGPRSQLAAPIFLEGRVIGAIGLESERLNAFTQEDMSFVSQLALQASVAIRNAQLYRNVQNVRDRLHAILDASNDGLLMIDPKGRIVMSNARMGDFWNFARQDFSTRAADEAADDTLSTLGEGLGYRAGELAGLLKHGLTSTKMKPQTDLYVTRPLPGQRQRFVERAAAPVTDDEGQFIGLLLIFRDVTEQKELEEARQSLTSMIVHELRSPLQAVMGSMRLIAQVSPAEDAIIEQATDVSKRAIKKLLNLVNNLLDLSRMEQGEFVLDPVTAPLKPILDDAVQELLPLAQEMSTVVRIEVPDDLPSVNVDRDMIGRVVLNLLDNALKYTEPGSLVTVEARLAKDGTHKGKVHVSVTDNGPGVPNEYKEIIFDRFAQIPGRRGRRRSAGLGLAFCKLAVESHGGQIWVKDNPEGGSIFSFTLPASAPPPPARDRDQAAAPDRPSTLAKPAPPVEPGSQPAADGGTASKPDGKAAKPD